MNSYEPCAHKWIEIRDPDTGEALGRVEVHGDGSPVVQFTSCPERVPPINRRRK
jgi:hypothetical protein